MNQEKMKISSLIKAIHQFYPIGTPNLGFEYPGYSDYKLILTDKIMSITENKKTQWTGFIKSLEKEYNPSTIIDMNYLQFPCHLARIELKKESNDEYDFEQSIVINISLLCKYYTIFFEEGYKFKNYTNQIIKPSVSMLFSNKMNGEDYFQKKMLTLKEKLEPFFSDYQNISHRPLFQYKIIGGFPYSEGESEQETYYLYHFLFDSFYKMECVYVYD